MNLIFKRILRELPKNKELIMFVRAQTFQDNVSVEVRAGLSVLRWFEYTDYGLVSGAPPVEYGDEVPVSTDPLREYILRAVVDGTVLDDDDRWVTLEDYLEALKEGPTHVFKYEAFGYRTPELDQEIVAIVNEFGEFVTVRGLATYTWRRFRNNEFDHHEIHYSKEFDPNISLHHNENTKNKNIVYKMTCKVQGHIMDYKTLWMDAKIFDATVKSV